MRFPSFRTLWNVFFGEVLSLFHLEQYEEAQKKSFGNFFKKKQPKDERFLFAGGVLALKHNDWERAAQYFSAFLLQNHEPEIARIFRGNALVALQHFFTNGRGVSNTFKRQFCSTTKFGGSALPP